MIEMAELEIRLYEERYFEDTCRLFHGVAGYYGHNDVHDEAATRDYVRDRVLGEDSDVRIALAIVGTQAVGLVTFSIMYPSPRLRAQLYIKELYVDEGHRGRGVGQALMKFMANYALGHGCNRMDWSAEKTNPKALEFYHAIGARPLTQKVYYRISDDDLEIFAKN